MTQYQIECLGCRCRAYSGSARIGSSTFTPLSTELMMARTTENRNKAAWKGLAILLSLFAVRTALAPADEKLGEETDSAKQRRAARLVGMRVLAGSFAMKGSATGEKQPFELHADP